MPLKATATATAIALILAAAPLAAQAQPKPAATAAQDPEYVISKEFRSRIFVVQHRSVHQLKNALVPLASGFKGSSLIANDSDGMSTISVRDFPENIAAIEDALKRLDVSTTAQKEVEFHIHVLFASKAEGAGGEVPEELKDVLASLKGTLSYRSYTPAASFVQRAKAGAMHLEGRGETEMPFTASNGSKATRPIDFHWKIRQAVLDAPSESAPHISLSEFEFSSGEMVRDHHEEIASMRTDLSLKDGDKVVVGTSVLKDRGLIVVLTAKVLN